MTEYFAGVAGRLEGSQDGRPALVLVHGLTFDSAMWQPGLAELRTIDPGRQTLVLDLPGHGGSPAWPSYDMPRASITVWPGSGHFPHLADPGRFAQSLPATAKLEDAA